MEIKEVNPSLPKVPIHLELGDWVYERGEVSRKLSPPMYVVGIWENGVYLEIDGEQGDPFEADYKDIVPIPFEDVADKCKVNTLVTKEYGCWHFWHKGTGIRFQYVHELQHLLRLVGINKEINLL